jgi:hypothetical protein
MGRQPTIGLFLPCFRVVRPLQGRHKEAAAMLSASSPDVDLSPWMSPDAKDTWVHLNSVVQKYRNLHFVRHTLQRLGHRPEMKDVWAELKHFDEVTPGSLLLMAFWAWLSALRTQPLGRDAVARASRKGHELAELARTLSNAICKLDRTTRTEERITDATLTELKRIAAFVERDAAFVDDMLGVVALPRKIRAKTADQVAFVNHMCSWLWRSTGRRRPYSLVAILTNVTFDVPETKEWDSGRVKKCYASRSRTDKSRGTLGSFLGQ